MADVTGINQQNKSKDGTKRISPSKGKILLAEEMSPLHPEIISKQATINIGK